MTGCFKLWALLLFRYDEASISGDDCLGKEPLEFPRGRACHIMQGPQREAPGLFRRQRGLEDNVGKSLCVDSAGKARQSYTLGWVGLNNSSGLRSLGPPPLDWYLGN